jgi:histidyl-tRNA synthetase
VFGGSPQEEDLEILLVCAQIMKELEAQSDWYLIQMNDRRITTDMLVTGAKLHADQIKNAIALIDKRDKIKPEEFKTQWNAMATRGTQSDAAIALGESKFLEHQQLFIKEFEEVLGKVQGNKSNAFFKSWLEQSSKDTAFNLSEAGKDALRNLLEIQDCFQRLMPDVKIEIDLSIARGFDYYTGIVFEVFDTHPENKRALFGGGRYDNLVGAFVQDKLPGVGFGVSDVSLLNFCEVHNIELDRGQNVDVAVARFSPEDRLVALELSALLRTQGLNCISPIADVKFGKQIQSAEKAGAIAVAFRGADEIQANTFAVKWLKTGEQENDFPFSEAGVLRLKGKLLQEKN